MSDGIEARELKYIRCFRYNSLPRIRLQVPSKAFYADEFAFYLGFIAVPYS